MKAKVYDGSIISTATITNKSQNQDCFGKALNDEFNALFLADGLGSYKYAKESSEKVISFFLDQAKRKEIVSLNFSDLYRSAKQNLIDFSEETITEEEKGKENLFGTTVISVLEAEGKLKFSYTGNGAIWHIRGNFTEFPTTYLFPWNAVNILNPHTIPENGKEALYRLVSDNNDFSECVPSVIEFNKDNEYGDIIMICTDGIYSGDQVKAGKNDKGVWVKYENTMLKFFEYLSHFFKSNTSYNQESLDQITNQYLEEIKPLLDDDATIGILITKQVLNYQNEVNHQRDEDNSGN